MVLKQIPKRVLLLIFAILAFFLVLNVLLVNTCLAQIDTLPSQNTGYQGYRLQLVNILVEKEKSSQRKIKCTLINTGREKINLPFKSGNTPKIIFQYDHSLEAAGLDAFKNALERSLLKQKITLNPGNIKSDFGLKFNVSKDQLAASKERKKKRKKKRDKPSEESFISYTFDKEYCADLRIDTFFVSKRSKKWVELNFKITNYGKGPAPMFGETKALEDNVAVRAYVSGTPKLSRGDMVLGGAYIEAGIEDKNGLLNPNESFSGSFRVDIRKKTRYMPYLILSVDDYQTLWECEERNNVMSLLDK